MLKRGEHEGADIARLGWVLSLSGFAPFAFFSITLFVLGQGHSLFLPVFDIFKTWSAVILSFLGGIRWGLAMAQTETDPKDLIASTIPAFIGWVALFLPDSWCVLTLLLCFCAMGAWDSLTVNAGKAPTWFGSLRTVLTFLVAASHVVVFFALFQS